jgi:transposase
VVESVDLEGDGPDVVLVARVRVEAGQAARCSRCRRRCPRYDAGAEQRRWRVLDLGMVAVYLQADTHRVRCGEHGVVVARLPWARHGARFATAFEDICAWLVAHAALSTVAILLRVAWRSVAAMVTRVVADRAARADRLCGLRRIGIDEISYRKGQRYLLVVVDHDTGRLVWAGKDRTAATAALDAVRRGAWHQLRRIGDTGRARELKGTRWALLKNPPDLTGVQRTLIAIIAQINKPLYRAYLLKEQLREVFATKGTQGKPPSCIPCV